MTALASVHAVLPPHRFAQAELTAAFTELCLGPDGNETLLARVHANEVDVVMTTTITGIACPRSRPA